MINTKATLKNLHKKFPLLSLDDLFNVLDCIVEDPYLKTNSDWWWNNPTITTTYNGTAQNCINEPKLSGSITAKTTDNSNLSGQIIFKD